MSPRPIGWLGIVRLGCVQAALGAIVVLCTSTMNRVMVVELALPAILPGALVALHYILQVLRPRLGYGSDVGGRRTPWIIGGMVLLAGGGVLASLATAWMGGHPASAIALALLAYTLIGIGVGASGTSLLVLLAKRVAPARRPAAATIVWLMMIAGIAITAGVAGKLLHPFSAERLVEITAAVGLLSVVMTALAVWGMEGTPERVEAAAPAAPQPPFRVAFAQVWAEKQVRHFAMLVFISMLAYSAQELIIEPFAGAVFHLPPGASTQLVGVQHGGVLLGMILLALAGAASARWHVGSLRLWMAVGCFGSAIGLLAMSGAGSVGPDWPLATSFFLLGVANGFFCAAAIGSMMQLAGSGRESREGVRMGLWGAAQALAFGLGGLFGSGAVDLARLLLGSPLAAYSVVFMAQAALFLFAGLLAMRVGQPSATRGEVEMSVAGDAGVVRARG
ncbi:Bacteriochlorophyll synthase 44.5 kDa chain [Rhodovastum atsumiense]|uniref:BCD family MFS transporter n=1 Tax=Rhodovastum atsumiense TaxID=504468 RepID=A0A5M6IX92_9PROT|nr:BCD family MFS transporter [Rhodovastum atsumiense]KAA5612912.1 BCD family MFS transporter [Rhodovastum atsumiense]CAH2601005.1 Bacteriochlorophyll synthase 44.5 kDa chain [Rhodovastum atsumiense]